MKTDHLGIFPGHEQLEYVCMPLMQAGAPWLGLVNQNRLRISSGRSDRVCIFARQHCVWKQIQILLGRFLTNYLCISLFYAHIKGKVPAIVTSLRMQNLSSHLTHHPLRECGGNEKSRAKESLGDLTPESKSVPECQAESNWVPFLKYLTQSRRSYPQPTSPRFWRYSFSPLDSHEPRDMLRLVIDTLTVHFHI